MDGTQGTGAPGFFEAIRLPYKEGQGAVTRRIGYWMGVGLAAWGARDLWVWLQGFGALQRPILVDRVAGIDLSHLPLGGPALGGSILIATIVGIAGWLWVAWFLNRPWLADLLIDTESEMKKVSWPGVEEAWAATKVVTATVVVFTVVLWVFDIIITGFMTLVTGLPL